MGEWVSQVLIHNGRMTHGPGPELCSVCDHSFCPDEDGGTRISDHYFSPQFDSTRGSYILVFIQFTVLPLLVPETIGDSFLSWTRSSSPSRRTPSLVTGSSVLLYLCPFSCPFLHTSPPLSYTSRGIAYLVRVTAATPWLSAAPSYHTLVRRVHPPWSDGSEHSGPSLDPEKDPSLYFDESYP